MDGVHWITIAIDFQAQTIECYDSKLGDHQELLEVTLRYLADEHRETCNSALDYPRWQLIHWQDTPRQDNDDDCGVFTCYIIDYLIQGKQFDFDATHSKHLRYRMALALVQGVLPVD